MVQHTVEGPWYEIAKEERSSGDVHYWKQSQEQHDDDTRSNRGQDDKKGKIRENKFNICDVATALGDIYYTMTKV